MRRPVGGHWRAHVRVGAVLTAIVPFFLATSSWGQVDFGALDSERIEAAVRELLLADDARVARALDVLADEDVERIEVEICLDPDERTVSGESVVHLVTRGVESTLLLNGALAVASVRDAHGSPLEYVRDEEVLTVHHAASEAPTSLRIRYEGELVPGSGVWVGDGFVFLSAASRWYPCPREADPSSFRIVVRYPEGYTSVATGSLAGMTPSDAARSGPCAVGDVWEARSPIAGAAVAVGRFTSSVSVFGGVLIGYHVYRGDLPPGVSADASRKTLDLKEVVRYLEGCYGPYPYEWLNVIFIPAAAAGGADVPVTAPGVIVIRGSEPAPGGDSSPRPERLVFGLSQTWWGHWMDAGPLATEGLAAAAEVGYLCAVGDEEGAARLRERRRSQYLRVLADAVPGESILGSFGLGGPADLRACRGRGAAVFELLERLLGREMFCGALRDVAASYGSSVVPLRELLTAFESASGRDLDWFFYEWVCRGDLPSYVLTYDVVADGDGFLVRGTIEQEGEIFRTPLPLTVELGGWSYDEWVAIESPEQHFEFRAEARPLDVVVDDEHLVPRADRQEMARIRYERGLRGIDAGDWKSAVDEFEAAVALDPGQAEYTYRYGDALVRLGRLTEGMEALEAAAQAAPERPDVRIALARLCLRSGNPEAALGHLDAYLARTPGDPAGESDRAIALVDLGRLAEAEESISLVRALVGSGLVRPSDLARFHLACGRYYEAVGDSASAVAAYEEALKVCPDAGEVERRLRALANVDRVDR